jgi:hypothetical protein
MKASGVWFGNAQWPSGSSPGAFARDVYRLESCKTDRDKALALNKWMVRCMNRGANLKVPSPLGGLAHCFDPTLLFTSWGHNECTGWAFVAVEALLSSGLKARRIAIANCAHTVYEVWYQGLDGKEGWHLFDPFLGWYLLNDAGEVPSCEELGANPDWATNPRPGGRSRHGHHPNPFGRAVLSVPNRRRPGCGAAEAGMRAALRAASRSDLCQPVASGSADSGVPHLAPRLLAAFGEQRDRFQGADELLKYSSIAPVTERSGKKSWVHWRWQCPTFLRQTFVEWAGQTINKSFWAGAYYRQQRAKGSSYQAAARALAFKWIRILYRCWQTRTRYDESTNCRSGYAAVDGPALSPDSPKRLATRAMRASSASNSSGPSVSSTTRLPLPAASIITPIKLLAFTLRPLCAMVTSHWYFAATSVSLAHADAFSPSSLTISTSSCGMNRILPAGNPERSCLLFVSVVT